jgi:hypothetical protein
MNDEINTLSELVREVSNSRTGGYEVDFEIQPNSERSRAGEEFFLVIKVETTEPGSPLAGEWWFFADNTVMQVL